MVRLNTRLVSHLLMSTDVVPAHVKYQRDRKNVDLPGCLTADSPSATAAGSEILVAQVLHRNEVKCQK
jgi:hypothetical protein